MVVNNYDCLRLRYSPKMRLKPTAYRFSQRRIYKFCTPGQRIEVSVTQLRRPLGRLFLIGDIASKSKPVVRLPQVVDYFSRIQSCSAVHTDMKLHHALALQTCDSIQERQFQRHAVFIFLIPAPREYLWRTANNGTTCAHLYITFALITLLNYFNSKGLNFSSIFRYPQVMN